LSTKVNKSVKALLDFTGENITRNLIFATRKSIIDISESDLRKVKAIVENAVEQSLINGYRNVEHAIKETISEASIESKNTKSRRK
jgi:hypothetical protein|tara:strand:- start:317 stop:574 length:258 start_codon:yes stop_codon:yes gene_type:complete